MPATYAQDIALDWGDLCRSLCADAWLNLLTKRNCKVARRNMNHLRAEQRALEGSFLASFPADEAKIVALELIAIYQLTAVAERLAMFLENEWSDTESTKELLDKHFKHALSAAQDAGSNEIQWLCLQLQTQAMACLRGDAFSVPPKMLKLLGRWSGN